ncbi:MAG: prepilin-type N-terminal cleavage/methylation domain-containing protein [Burkholderiales bacterium]
MNIEMKSAQSGFTLIELVVVIVILGILAATALPKFIDLTGNANQAAVQGVAGGLSSASSINYGGCAVAGNPAGGNGTTCTQITYATPCTDAGKLLSPAMTIATASAAGVYSTVAAGSPTPTANGQSVACVLTLGTGKTAVTANYSAIAAGN